MKSLHDFLPATLHRGYFNTVVPSRVPRPEQAEIRHSQFLLIIPVYFFIPDKKKPPCLTCVTNPEMTLLPYRDEEGCWGQCTKCPNPVGMSSQPCPEEIGAARLQQLLSDSSWHHRPAPKPVDTAELPLAFISSGSHPWHLVHASLFIKPGISGSSLPGKTGQLIPLLKEAI